MQTATQFMAVAQPCRGTGALSQYDWSRVRSSYLDRPGLFVDETCPFWGPGLIVLRQEQCERRAYGLVNSAYEAENDWSIDDTYGVLDGLCHRWNDERASMSWDISADIGAPSR